MLRRIICHRRLNFMYVTCFRINLKKSSVIDMERIDYDMDFNRSSQKP